MTKFDITNKTHRSLRSYRTHAFVARMFAEHPIHRSNSAIWDDIARSWEDLAELQECMALSNLRIAQLRERAEADIAMIGEMNSLQP